MALTSLGMLLEMPPIPLISESASGTMVIDAAGELAAGVFQIPQAGDVTGVFLRTGPVTTSTPLSVGLQTVSAVTGDPDGGAYKGSAVGTIAAPASNTNYEVTLGTQATAAVQGDVVALVVGFTAAVGNLAIFRQANVFFVNGFDFPYTDGYVGVGPAWSQSGRVPSFALKYSDGSYVPIPGLFPQPSTSSMAFASGSTPDERGNKFQLPFGCRVVGYWVNLGAAIPATGLSVVLYDSDGSTPLFTSTPDPEQERGGAGLFTLMLASPVTLLASTWYRLTVLPGASNVTIYDWTWPSAAMLGALPLGANCQQCQRTNAGAWTDTNTASRVLMGLLIDQIDVSAGGGGGVMLGMPNLMPTGADIR